MLFNNRRPLIDVVNGKTCGFIYAHCQSIFVHKISIELCVSTFAWFDLKKILQLFCAQIVSCNINLVKNFGLINTKCCYFRASNLHRPMFRIDLLILNIFGRLSHEIPFELKSYCFNSKYQTNLHKHQSRFNKISKAKSITLKIIIDRSKAKAFFFLFNYSTISSHDSKTRHRKMFSVRIILSFYWYNVCKKITTSHRTIYSVAFWHFSFRCIFFFNSACIFSF